MAQILPIAALRGKERVVEPLKGDVYTRSWTSVEGKGKKKRIVQHEVHVNPLTLVVAGVGAAGAGLLGALALHGMGKQVSMTAQKQAKRIVDEYQPEYEDVKVVDTPYRAATADVYEDVPAAYRHDVVGMKCSIDGEIYTDPQLIANHSQMHIHSGEGAPTWSTAYTDVLIHPASTRRVSEGQPEQLEESHLERRLKTELRVVVMSNRYVPHGTYGDLTEALEKMQARYTDPRNLQEKRSHWVTINGKEVLRHFYTFDYRGVGTEASKPWFEGGVFGEAPWPFGPLLPG